MHNIPWAEDWLVATYFNMLESKLNTSGNLNASVIKGQELHAWRDLTWKMQIADMWHLSRFCQTTNSSKYSREGMGMFFFPKKKLIPLVIVKNRGR